MMHCNPVADATLDVGLRLVGALRRVYPHQNLLVAPPAVMTGLALLANGAEDSARRDILAALGLLAVRLERLNRAFAELRRGIEASRTSPRGRPPSEPHVRVEQASGLWAAAGLDLAPEVVRRCREFY